MTKNKLAIIGGSGLYDVEEFKEREFLKINTPWGQPSDEILKIKYKGKEVCFLPRHGKGHLISPSKIKNFNIKIAKDGILRKSNEILTQKGVDMKKIREIWPQIPFFDEKID